MGFLSAGAHRRPDWACLTPSHPLPAEGKSVTLSQQRESRQSAVPVTSLAWPLSLPFLWLNILISGITEAIFFFPAEKQKQKQIYPQPLKQEGEFCGWRALKDSKIPKGICAPRPRKCPKPKASILPPTSPLLLYTPLSFSMAHWLSPHSPTPGRKWLLQPLRTNISEMASHRHRLNSHLIPSCEEESDLAQLKSDVHAYRLWLEAGTRPGENLTVPVWVTCLQLIQTAEARAGRRCKVAVWGDGVGVGMGVNPRKGGN